MSQVLRLRRGSTADHSTFTGKEAELTYDTDKKVPVIHDGSTVGGFPLAADSDQSGDVLVRGDGIIKIQAIFQSDYDLLDPPDQFTLYVILPNTVVIFPAQMFLNGNDAFFILQ